jgi:uncharacterized protein (DUF2147 family)
VTRAKLCAAVLLAACVLAARAADESAGAMGVLIDPAAGDEAGTAVVLRDGKEVPVFNGMEVFPGDALDTRKSSGLVVAFFNNDAVELGDASRLAIQAPNAAGAYGTLILNQGHMQVASQAKDGKRLNFGIGDTLRPAAEARATIGIVKLDIIVLPDGNGGFKTTVACIAGTATLVPVSSNSVNIVTGMTGTLLTTHTPVTGVTNSPVDISPSTLSKADLKALQMALKLAAVGSETTVAVVGNLVVFKSTIKNSDGSVSKGTVTTTTSGVTVKDKWKTVAPDKSTQSWTEHDGKIKVTQSFNGIKFSATLKGNTAVNATIHDSTTKQTYTGTATYDPQTGIITFTTTKPGKDGSTATYVFDPNSSGTYTVTRNNVPQPPVVFVVPQGPPPATTPDNHVIGPNSPVSQ